MVEHVVGRVRERLRDASDPEFARRLQNYFEDIIDAWGVRSPVLHEIADELFGEIKNWSPATRTRLFEALWENGKFEDGMIVCHAYRRFAGHCGRADWRVVERWFDRHISNWPTADALARWILAPCIDRDRVCEDELLGWTASSSRWKRRAAAVALIEPARKNRHIRSVFDVAAGLMLDPERIVQVGVGRLLYFTYLVRPREVMEFLTPWRDRAPRIVLRLAAQRMLDDDRGALFGANDARRACNIEA